MRLSKQSRRDAKQLFRACQVEGVLDEARARQTVEAVLEKKPRGYLAVLHHFQRLIKLDLERHSALVESATALPGDLQQQVRTSLSQVYGEGLDVRYLTNPKLVGGMRVRVGSDVYDGSILGRLERLRESF